MKSTGSTEIFGLKIPAQTTVLGYEFNAVETILFFSIIGTAYVILEFQNKIKRNKANK